MRAADREALLNRLSLQLESTESQRQIVELVAAEVRNTLGYRTTWLGIYSSATHEYRVLAAELAGSDDLWDSSEPVPVDGDPYISKLIKSSEPQVIVDAQVSDQVNREIVEQLGNRTVINVPILLGGDFFGAIGTGTFGDEGVKEPSDEDLAYLSRLGRSRRNGPCARVTPRGPHRVMPVG